MRFGRRPIEDTEISNYKQPKFDAVKRFGNVVGEVLRIQDVIGFFKYDINPSYLDAKVEAAIAKENRGKRSIPIAWVIVIGALLMFGAIAFVIVSGQLNNSSAQTQLIECLKGGPSKVITTPQQTSPPPTAITSGSGGVGIQ